MEGLVIGRLQRMECQSGSEFEGFGLGENITAKILKVSKGKKITFLNY